MSDTGSGLPTAEEVENINNTGEAYVTRPTTQIDLERRQAIEDGEVDPNEDAGVARDFRVEGNKTDGYIGVSPEYKTYANDTEAPLLAEDGRSFTKVPIRGRRLSRPSLTSGVRAAWIDAACVLQRLASSLVGGNLSPGARLPLLISPRTWSLICW